MVYHQHQWLIFLSLLVIKIFAKLNDYSNDERYAEFSAGKGERGLFPNIFNLATHADIRATATCGQYGPEYYCKLVEHVFARAPQCDVCDANNHYKNHPIDYAIDGTPRHWQSPSLANGLAYEKVNITLDLRQEYQVAYVIVKAGNAPRPGTWVLEKSMDGVNYQPWQYFAINDAECMRAFGMPATVGVATFKTDDEVICTSFYSKLEPLENGEIHISLVNQRPSAEHPSQTLQNFTRTRFVRLRMLSLRTLNADLMIINRRDGKLDQSVTRRYFYSIKDISIGGQCICYGHAESCPPEEIHGQFRCECRHNTCGESCETCCPLFNQLPWQPGTHAHPNVCQPCQCFNHADRCEYDESIAEQGLSLTPDGVYEGGGKCIDCQHNTEGINCEKCKTGYYRPSNISHYQHDACVPCDCDMEGSEHNQCIRDETTAFNGYKPGDCICKPGFGGRRCEKCAPGYRNYPKCERCPCNQAGSLNFETCEEKNCICKTNVEGQFCDRCKPGTIFLNPNNPQGCQPCFCFGKSTTCREGFWDVGHISNSNNWTLTELHNFNSVIKPKSNSSELLIFNSNDYPNERQLFYWKAPSVFSGDLLNSYGGDLRYYAYFVPQKDASHPTPVADVIIEGNGIRIEHYSRLNFFPRENISVTIPLLEKDGWYNSQTRQPIDKSDLMRVLSDVKFFLIRARYTQEQLQSSIYGLTLETAIPSKTSNKNETSNSVLADLFNFSSKKMNGVEVCDCPENFAGNSCEKCVAGYRRVNNQLYGGRCEKCNCEGHSDTCDPFTGNCLDCKHNTTGPRCEQCLPGHYGNPLLGDELGSCKPCACPNIENNHSPQCTLSQLVLEDAARANQDEYVCTACEQGYDGNKCEICADGYFGDPATGTCQQCSCNGNIDLAAIGNCDRVTGECLRCIGPTTGESCERCEDNHWGSALDKTCKPCGCHHVGSTSLQCSNSTGLCDCHENYIGDRCDSCKPGHGDIEANCPECDCDQVGSIGTSCNQISGQCNCKAGIYGKRCDMCFPGYFNFTDQGCSFCHCDEYGSVDQKCSNTTGECECRENVEGTRCDHCVPGYFNITSKLGCQECSCNEIGSTSKECNAISGKCVCKEGVTGLKCDKCEPNHWGFDENGCKQCQKCPAPGQVCDPENGECVCPPNTIGDKCENCTKNSWNYDQYRGCELCDCDGIGSDSSECNPSTGQCKCKSGFVGHKCDHCQAGYFNFPNCEPCNCDLNGTDPLECRDDTCLCSNDGQCKCKQHVTGLKCDQCDSNSFSLDKYNLKGCTECFCFNRTNFCVQNSMVWQQLYTSDRRIIFEEPFIEFDRKMNLQILKEYPNNYNSYLSNHAPLYWPLPRTFLGDRINSYNGYLRFKIWNEDNYRKQHGIKPELNTFKLFPQVLLIGNDRIILENVADEVSEDNKYKVKLHETKWKNKMSPQIPVTRQQMMVVLQNLQAVYIRGTYNHMYRGDAISLRDVSMDIAVENVTDSESTVAIGVELCADCPEGYSGSSCQNPANGYCRKKIPGYLNSPDDLALIGYSTPCACNGHSTTCDPETCRCTDCQHNTMGDFCEICKPGYHGDAKEGSIDSCVKCACPLATNSFSDTCIAAETGRGYACDACKPGYSGLYCETCIPGYFGDPNTEGGYCQQCNCHPHGSLSPYCHNVTGQCECREGVDKRDCSGCRPRHAFISRVCTSCDQGCYKDLMIMEDEMETKLLTVQNLSDSKPIPKKRLRKINEAISSYDEILNNIKINENSATYLPNIEEDNKLIKEALFVIEEASVLDEKTNETLNKLNKLQNDIQKIRKIGHDQNQRVIDISTTLNKFSTEISQQIPANVENRVEEAERILENLREKEKQLEKQLNYVSKNSEDATVLLKEVLSKKLNDTSYDLLFEQHEERRKLIKDFRDTIWDEGKTNSTMAKKLTKLVNDRLEELKNLVDEIEKNVAEKENDLSKTNELIETIKQIMLDSHDNYQEINNNLSGDLQKKVDDLKTMTEKNVEEMRKDKSKLHKAQQHAKEMEHKAKRLKNQIADTNQFSNNALAATNSYKDIVESLVNASVAANEAKTASEDAFNEIGGEDENSIVNQARQHLEESEKIKKEFDELDNDDVDDGTKQLKSILEKIKKITETIEKEMKEIKEAQNDLDDHEERISHVKENVEQVRDVVNDVIKPIDKISKDVDELRNRIDGIENFNLQAINEDILNVTNSNSEMIKSKDKLDNIKERTNKQTEDLKNVKQRISILKEKMNEAKEKASKIKISVKSDPKDYCIRQYISPSNPSPTTTINIKFRPAMDVPDSLIFLTLTKSRRTQAREFLAIEMKDRRIIVHWNIGHNSRRATNPHNIFYIAPTDRYTWYHIDVTRIGNAIKFSVGQKQSLKGEDPKNIDEPTIVTLGEPDVTSDVIMNTVPGETRIHLGYDDVELTNELGLGTNKFTGILGEMKIDGQDIPLWVFAKQIGNCDGAIGIPNNPVQGHFFRNGFAQIRMPMIERTNAMIRIVYAAYSTDGLLYFRGNTANKNFIAVEVRNGAINVKANYGDKSYVQLKSSGNTYADGKVHVIKITRNNTELELQVDDDDDRGSITIPGNNDVMNLHDEDPHFVGGVPSDYDKAVFAEKDINWNGFVGCIQVVKPNQLHELDLDHPVRSQRQEPGCTFKEDKLISADRVIGFPKPGYLVAESIQLNTNSSLAFNLKTKNGNAVLLYQKSLKKTFKREADDNDTFFAFYLYNGRLIVHLGTDTVDRLKRPSISSNQSYNDGRLHSIFFARQGSSIEVRIDDREVLRGQLSDDKIIGSKTSKLYFGGLPDKLRIKNENIDIGTTEPLIGCLSDFYYNFEKWSIIPEKHEAQLGTCVFNEEITHETDDMIEQKSFERKSSKISLQLAAPTYISNNDGFVSVNDQLLVNTLSDTCYAPSGKVLEEAKKEGARYGASETSHSRLTFDRPYPDPKNFAISFSFRTETSDGIIWIWANYKNYTRYFLMYIEDGFLMIDIQGSQNKKQLQYKEKRFDDGQWHELKLTKENRELTVQVDDLLSEKITDAASPSVMRRRMYVGGVISKHKKIFKFPHDNFIGCIKNFIVDGNEKDLHAQTRDVILCKKTKDIAYLHKGGFMTFAPLKSFNGPATDNQNIDVSIKFRTNNATGTLLALLSSSGFESKTGVLVEIKNNDLIFKADHAANGVQLEHKLHLPEMCQSEWHRFHLTLTRSNIIMSIDEAHASFPITKLKKSTMDIFKSLPVYVGGLSANLAEKQDSESLNGCYHEIHFAGTITQISSAKRLHKVVADGCPLV